MFEKERIGKGKKRRGNRRQRIIIGEERKGSVDIRDKGRGRGRLCEMKGEMKMEERWKKRREEGEERGRGGRRGRMRGKSRSKR